MSKKMLINATHAEENRVAIVENGVLTDLGIEVAGREPTKGNIYKAAVVRVEPGLQAAFVDYGAERLGFLQIDEVNAAVVKPDLTLNGRPRIQDLLHRGQEILVQIIKEERGTKGAALTTYLSLAGRYMVLMPDTQTRGVSRKAEDDKQRKQMKKALSSLDLPENVGCIVRTAALDQTREELERDYLYLMRLFENIRGLEKKVKAPALIYKESNLVIRSIRDYFTTDMDEVLIDDPEVFREAREFFEVVMPDHVGLVKLHQERRPIFSRFQIEEQIDMISRNKVPLPSGGSIVIDTTEALVAIDVNSGKLAGEQNVEATATRTNLEAAEEVARQLRLRDLGGLIVIDFIDMRERKHMRQVEECLKEATARDKARINIGQISQFGLLEMSRQRIKAALAEGIYRICPHCQGIGRVRSVETLAVSVLRRLHAVLAKGQIAEAEVQLARDAASFLLNEKREELVEMERRYQSDIQITGRTSFLADQVELTVHKREKEKNAAEYVEAKLSQLPARENLPAPDASEEPVAEESKAAEAATKTGKKRRRKRKRKTDEEVSTEALISPMDVTSEMTSEVKSSAAGDLPGDETQQGVDVPKKKRRRRSKKKAAVSDGVATDLAVATVVEVSSSETMPVATESHVIDRDERAPETENTGKKRRRRARKKPEASVGESEPIRDVPPLPLAANPDPPVDDHSLADVQEKKIHKTRRRPQTKTSGQETASSAQTPIDKGPSAEEASDPDLPAIETGRPARSRANPAEFSADPAAKQPARKRVSRRASNTDQETP